ncbi:hypothetical protein LX36DRAFT_192986 [Colletotrichum falcatum]|nr:hypothetical protein LX36DRAFT_192986 [Colletotrichum falcatum]
MLPIRYLICRKRISTDAQYHSSYLCPALAAAAPQQPLDFFHRLPQQVGVIPCASVRPHGSPLVMFLMPSIQRYRPSQKAIARQLLSFDTSQASEQDLSVFWNHCFFLEAAAFMPRFTGQLFTVSFSQNQNRGLGPSALSPQLCYASRCRSISMWGLMRAASKARGLVCFRPAFLPARILAPMTLPCRSSCVAALCCHYCGA